MPDRPPVPATFVPRDRAIPSEQRPRRRDRERTGRRFLGSVRRSRLLRSIRRDRRPAAHQHEPARSREHPGDCNSRARHVADGRPQHDEECGDAVPATAALRENNAHHRAAAIVGAAEPGRRRRARAGPHRARSWRPDAPHRPGRASAVRTMRTRLSASSIQSTGT